MKAACRLFWTLTLLSTLAMAQAPAKPIELTFAKLLRVTSRSLEPTPTLAQADGKRVRISGYMAQMEAPAIGGFWLVPSPVFQDESGAGTGDLPPNAVFVKVRGAGKKPVAYLRGLLSVSGTLKLHASSPRIIVTLDSQKDIAQPKPKRKS